jgi:oxygen-independent coproporphyrinogen-3 oxidase
VWKRYYEQVTGGVSLEQAFREKFDRLKEFGLITEDSEKIELSSLGAFVADEVVQQFHAQDFIPYPAQEYAYGPLHPYANCETSVEPALSRPINH